VLSQPSRSTKVIVATTVMLSFISFWRAAAIVLSDLASSAYYAGGIAESAIGKSAPWFILAIMLFGFAIRAIYIESCGMFVRGGVYKVVHEALGPTLAKFSVSALMFDYVLTGPISGVSAGLYFAGLINEAGPYFGHPGWQVDPPGFAAGFALLVTIYFWSRNRIGIHESSEKALRIMQITSVMVVILIAWCALTIFTKGYQPVPLPGPSSLRFGAHSLGWLNGSWLSKLTFIAILVGLGHSLLAMSGFETLAQVYREIKAPKLKNLEKTGLAVITYSLAFTSLVSFFAVMLIPDAQRSKYLDNLIGGLSMFLVGPTPLKLAFHAFVVLVGTLILAGAVNTAIIGSNGVLNRVAEDGVLPDWFRHPHPRYGTTSRLINLVVILQIATIIFSRGDVIMLGEAYAFGVVWSFAMKALSVLVLRYKKPEQRAWKVPGNLRIAGVEIPWGLGLITLFLFTLAITNVLTKKTATISGSAFTIAFFIAFALSERHNARKRTESHDHEKFRLDTEEQISGETIKVRPGNVLVAVRSPEHLGALDRVLEKSDPNKQDVVVLTVHMLSAMSSGEHALEPDQIFSKTETELFSKVVSRAEAAGKHVELMVVPGPDPYYTIVHMAQRIQSSKLVIGQSAHLSPAEQGRLVGNAWEQLPQPRPALSLEVVPINRGPSVYFNLGPHPPRLWPEDIELVHELWLELSERFGAKLRHRDVVGLALRRLSSQLHNGQQDEIYNDAGQEIAVHAGQPVEESQPVE
jgi:amino acid transporter